MKKQLVIWGVIAAIMLTTVVFAANIEQLTANVVQLRILVNDEERNFENPIITINNRTYVPLREVSEVLGMDVEWHGRKQEITINSPPELYNEWGIVLNHFEQDGLRGYKDALGNVIIEPQFAFVRSFSEGLAFVSKEIESGEFRGYIDAKGNLVVPLPTVEAVIPMPETYGFNAFEYRNGFAVVVVRRWEPGESIYGLYGSLGPFIYIDKKGENIFGMEFTTAGNFDESGTARVTLFDGTKTFIDREGNITGESWSF